MKNTFKERTDRRGTSYYYEQVNKLRVDLGELVQGNVSAEEAVTYAVQLLDQAEVFDEDSMACFWALDDPQAMPSDARVDFIYIPTYVSASMLAYMFLHYEKVRNLPGIEDKIGMALNGCMGRVSGGLHFAGSGYDGTKGFLDAMEIFADGGMQEFMEAYPAVNPAFTKVWEESVHYIREQICTGRVTDPWSGENYAGRGEAIMEKLQKDSEKAAQYLFVYGTLMKDQPASHMLKGCECLGKFILKDYALYDLGAYPGVVPEAGETTVGEVYEIREEDFEKLDAYEGNGILYIRRQLPVESSGRIIDAWVYVYQHSTGEKLLREPWGCSDDDPVWYAVYGSNLKKERFLCYLAGGTCAENGRSYKGCRVKTLPCGEDSDWFAGSMYFGNHSSSWGGKGVAFYDPQAAGRTYMRLYRITRSQFRDIRLQEGASDRWYGKIVTLGIHKDGIPVCTLTSESRNQETAPSEEYLNLIHRALVEENGFTAEEAYKYLKEALE